MAEYLFAFLAFVVAVLALSLGTLFGRETVRGSCGGLSAVPGVESDCGGVCRRPCPRRRKHAGSHYGQAAR